jgi:hypothetical protein
MAAIDGTRPPNVDVFVDADRQTATRQPFIDVSSPVVDPTPIQPHLASSASPSPSLKGSDRENDGMLRRIEEITQSLRMLKGRTEPVRIDSHLRARQPAGDTDQLPVSRLHPSTEAPFTSSPRELQAPPRIVPESLPLHSRAAIAPTVNVTIGRVEVKAGADRQPLPARREPVSRVMSLDQYLAGRAAGGRR